MKTVFKALLTSCTFYSAILSLLMIFNHCYGGDSNCMILVGFNPILKAVCYNNFGLDVISQGPLISVNFTAIGISIYWYAAHFITFVLYGAVLDGLKALVKNLFNYLRLKLAAAKKRNFEHQAVNEILTA